jgi:hypothetical protein
MITLGQELVIKITYWLIGVSNKELLGILIYAVTHRLLVSNNLLNFLRDNNTIK